MYEKLHDEEGRYISTDARRAYERIRKKKRRAEMTRAELDAARATDRNYRRAWQRTPLGKLIAHRCACRHRAKTATSERSKNHQLEMVEFLTAEIEQLRARLAWRDAAALTKKQSREFKRNRKAS